MSYNEKYVTSAGAGAADGSSLANAWSWATMLTSLAAGDRANVQGAISRTTSADVFTNNGTTAIPIAIRGINSTLGDLEANGRTRGGGLVTTNFPVVTYTTGSLTLPNFCVSENMSVTSARTNPTVIMGSNSVIRRSVVNNTHASSSTAQCLDASTGISNIVSDCDFAISSTSASAYAINMASCKLANCLVTGSNGASLITAGARSLILDNMFRDAGLAIAVQTGTGIWVAISGNSFRNISGVYVNVASTTGITSIENNAAWGSGGSSKWFNSTTSVRAIFQSYNAIGNFGAADTNEGDWSVSNEIALSADPFVSSTDLSLNSTTGGGAACKSAGYFAYRDVGAWQTQSSGGSGPLSGPGRLIRN